LLSSSAPILLLCLARPELAERRREWPVALRLEPLPDAEVYELIPERLTGDLRGRITRACGGNPLFVTEMVAVAAVAGVEVVVPPTLQALLAARLDQLEGGERSVLERASVEGEIFHRGAVQALSDRRQVTPRLASLVRKDLIRPDKAQIPGEDAFRFRHLLLRDAAYAALPKAVRGELHERLAAWLERRAEELVELEEIVGFHMEQAARFKAELGQPDPGLAERAGERLAAAERRALWRADHAAAATLLERSLELLRPLRLDVHLELDLASAQVSWRRTTALAEATADRARDAGDQVGELLARFVAAEARTRFEPEPGYDELEALAQEALPVLEQAQDHLGLSRVWLALGSVADVRGRNEEWATASEHAIKYARLGGHQFTRLFGFPLALVLGPRPADDALRSLDGATPPNPHPNVQASRAWLLAMLGRFEEAWAMARDAAAQTREITLEPWTDRVLAEIAMLAGDHESAAESFRVHCELLEQRDALSVLSTYAPALGRALCALGRYDEAERLAQRGRELGDERDATTQMLWRQVQARVHAARGEHQQAEALAREAVAIAERTDALNYQGDALCDLAEVLAAAGRTDAAAAVLKQARGRYERKKNLAMTAQVRKKLDELHRPTPT
jgi:tetratricopeptide (TPR) repeat protein